MNEKKNDITWKLMRVDEIGDVISGGTPSTTNPDYWNGEIPFITPLDLSKNGGAYISNVQRYITVKGLENSSSNLLPPNSLAISSRAPIGYLSLCKASFVTNQGCKSINFNKNQSPIFHYYNFQLYVNEMKRYGVGTTFSEISKGDLCRLKVNVPEDIVIQENIAQILKTCDKVIEQTEAVIAKYKAIKQGMLHDLFTRGLDKNGKLRPTPAETPEFYKESELGLIPKDWDVKRLNEIATMKSGEGITSQFISNHGNYPVYGGNGLRGFTSSYTHEGEFVLIGRQGALCGNTVRVTGKFYASEHAVVVNTFNFIDVDWLFQKLKGMDLNKYSEASAQPGLAVSKILQLFIDTPSHNEQMLISKSLLSIDCKLLCEEKVLEKYRSMKMGLMHNLLDQE